MKNFIIKFIVSFVLVLFVVAMILLLCIPIIATIIFNNELWLLTSFVTTPMVMAILADEEPKYKKE